MNNQFSGPNAWGDYLTVLEKATPVIEALAVTDYYVTDTYEEVLQHKAAGRLPSTKLVFPNVELRRHHRSAPTSASGRKSSVTPSCLAIAIGSGAGEETHDHSIMTVPLRTIRKPGDPPVEALQDPETGPPEPAEYFAYGSNMETARLRERMPSAKPLGVAKLSGHELRFHKRSKDGSGKCNAFAPTTMRVPWSVYYPVLIPQSAESSTPLRVPARATTPRW
jgi:hypothetical protein